MLATPNYIITKSIYVQINMNKIGKAQVILKL